MSFGNPNEVIISFNLVLTDYSHYFKESKSTPFYPVVSLNSISLISTLKLSSISTINLLLRKLPCIFIPFGIRIYESDRTWVSRVGLSCAHEDTTISLSSVLSALLSSLLSSHLIDFTVETRIYIVNLFKF